MVGSERQCIGHLLGMGFNLAGTWFQVQVWEVGFGGWESQEGPLQGLGRVDSNIATHLLPEREDQPAISLGQSHLH